MASEVQHKLESFMERNSDRWILMLKNISSNREGREFLADYMLLCHLSSSAYTGNSDTYFKLGQQYIALRVQNDLREASFDNWVAMWKESVERDNLRKKEKEDIYNG